MRYSLKQKTLILIILIALVVSAASIVVSVKVVSDIVRVNYEEKATELSDTAAAIVDAEAVARLQKATQEIYDSLTPQERVSSDDWGSDEFYEYLSHFEPLTKTDDYKEVLHQLRMIQDANDVDCVYTSFIDVKTEKFIYLVDAAHEDPCPIGCFDPLYEQNRRLLKDPTIGFPTYTTNTEEYGYLATSGSPIYDKTKTVVAYAMVDVSMDDIATYRHKLLAILLGLQILITGIVILISILLVNRTLVRPINQLSRAAAEYCQEDDIANHSRFAALNIRTKDEIQGLSESMKEMEQDLNDIISNLMQTTHALTETRKEADELNVLATKDALTGVNNKRAYDAALQKLDDALAAREENSDRFGLVVLDLNDLKEINDVYGHEKGDIAIKELCRVICSVFAHSPVFRIGGDEFAIVLQGHDFEHIDELMVNFNSDLIAIAENADLKPWEKVSAAIGYARFDASRDNSAGATFRQADRAMYLRKQEMKVGRDFKD